MNPVQLPPPLTSNPPPRNPRAVAHRKTVPADVSAVIEAMEPGRYTTATLYAAYVQVAEANGREPGNVFAFGTALRHDLRVAPQRTTHARMWSLI